MAGLGGHSERTEGCQRMPALSLPAVLHPWGQACPNLAWLVGTLLVSVDQSLISYITWPTKPPAEENSQPPVPSS